MNTSKRHHYIPKFLIKGFTGSDNKLAVFDKRKGCLLRQRMSPKQVFFEWNRNNFEVNGKESDFVEKLFQFGENKFAPIYLRIIEKLETEGVSAFEWFNIMHFISITFWRLPSQDSDIEEFITNLKNENSIISVINSKDKNQNIKALQTLINEPSFIGSGAILKAMEEYIRYDNIGKIKNWKLYYIPEHLPSLHLLSDNPLIIKDRSSSILDSELIFPFSFNRIVFNNNGKTIHEIPPEIRVSIDVLVFSQSSSLVCGPDSSYLKSIAHLANEYEINNTIEGLKNDVFSIFK